MSTYMTKKKGGRQGKQLQKAQHSLKDLQLQREEESMVAALDASIAQHSSCTLSSNATTKDKKAFKHLKRVFGKFAAEFQSKQEREIAGRILSALKDEAKVESLYWGWLTQACKTKAERAVNPETLYASDVEVAEWSSALANLSRKRKKVGHGTQDGKGDERERNEEEGKVVGDNSLRTFCCHPGSLFRYLRRPIPGVTDPMVYIGMLFSTFCWHIEDSYLPSLSFHHAGATRTWYGVPKSNSSKLQRLVGQGKLNISPSILAGISSGRISSSSGTREGEGTFSAEQLRGEVVMATKSVMIPPQELLRQGVQVCKLVQRPGDLVVTWPQAYHSGFSHGLSFTESVNFSPVSWLPEGLEAEVRCAKAGRDVVMAHHELVYRAALSIIDFFSCNTKQPATRTEVQASEALPPAQLAAKQETGGTDPNGLCQKSKFSASTTSVIAAKCIAANTAAGLGNTEFLEDPTPSFSSVSPTQHTTTAGTDAGTITDTAGPSAKTPSLLVGCSVNKEELLELVSPAVAVDTHSSKQPEELQKAGMGVTQRELELCSTPHFGMSSAPTSPSTPSSLPSLLSCSASPVSSPQSSLSRRKNKRGSQTAGQQLTKESPSKLFKAKVISAESTQAVEAIQIKNRQKPAAFRSLLPYNQSCSKPERGASALLPGCTPFASPHFPSPSKFRSRVPIVSGMAALKQAPSQAFVAGVTSSLNQLANTLAVETKYVRLNKKLGFSQEPWTLEHSAGWCSLCKTPCYFSFVSCKCPGSMMCLSHSPEAYECPKKCGCEELVEVVGPGALKQVADDLNYIFQVQYCKFDHDR